MSSFETDTSDIKKLIENLRRASSGDFKKCCLDYLDGTGNELLRVIEDEIIRLKSVDTRLLLNSFHKGDANNVYQLMEGNLILEIGTNVEYAQFVNDGHWANPQGIERRFVPGEWSEGKFRYKPGSSKGMMLKQQYISGTHYMEHSIKIIEKMFPKLTEKMVQKAFESYLKI